MITRYYIDFDNGNDDADGLTKSTALKTIPGTRLTNNTDYLRATWAAGTITTSNKVPNNTHFILKRGTTFDSTKGGVIQINRDYYNTISTDYDNYIIKTEQDYGSGNTTINFAGATVGIAGLLIQCNGISIFANYQNNIIIRDSPLSGIQFKEHPGTGDAILYTRLGFIKLYNNGTSIISDTDGASIAGVHFRRSQYTHIYSLHTDGNNQFHNGIMFGESNKTATDILVEDCYLYNQKGDFNTTNDTGAGIKILNGNNVNVIGSEIDTCLKGFDGGEHNGNNATINYKINGNHIHDCTVGIACSNYGDNTYTGVVTYYILNNIIRHNKVLGINMYAGPFIGCVVHNTLDDNGYDTALESGAISGNLRFTPNTEADNGVINIHCYNNILYKPYEVQLSVPEFWTTGTQFNLDMDYNCYVRKNTPPGSNEWFCRWAYFNAAPDNNDYDYGNDGPGHNSGNWYNNYSYNTTPPVNGQLGHYHNDANSMGTGCTNTSIPAFFSATNYILTTNISGLNLSTKPWFIRDMLFDSASVYRVNWTVGAHEYV